MLKYLNGLRGLTGFYRLILSFFCGVQDIAVGGLLAPKLSYHRQYYSWIKPIMPNGTAFRNITRLYHAIPNKGPS